MKLTKKMICVILAMILILPCLTTETVAETLTNKTIVYNFLKSEMDINDAVICGIMANIQCESSFNPTARYTEANGSLSYGICQWNSGRLEALKKFCSERGYTYTTLTGQLYYLKYELENGESAAFAKVRDVENNADGAYLAGYNWAKYFERCASSSYEKRANLAKDTYWPVYGYPVVRASIIMERINTLSELLEGKYFTVNQRGCRLYERTHKCSNCLSKTIAGEQWFIDLFGSNIDPTRQFPYTYYSDGSHGSRYGWSCYGFAGFAEWYIFKNDNTDRVDVTYEGTYSYNYENCRKYVRTGDLLRLNDSHSVIAIEPMEDGLLVLDCNYVGDYNCEVSTHVIGYEVYSKFAISRAENSVEIKKYNFNYNANGGTIEGGDALIYHYTVASTNGLNMRNGAGTSCGKVVALPYKTTVTATEFKEADGYTWGYVTYGSYKGWIVVSESWTTLNIEHVSAFYLDENGTVIDGTTDKAVSDTMTAGTVYSAGLWGADHFSLAMDGFSFLGWSTEPQGPNVFPAGCAIIPDELVIDVEDTSEPITLYAVWNIPAQECTHESFVTFVTDSSCDDDGFTSHICESCGYKYVDNVVPATGHDFTVETISSGCAADGYNKYTCTRCGFTYTDELPAANHAYVAKVTAPTCLSEGWTEYTCSVCGHSYRDDVIPALGHKFFVETVAPTCTEEGYTLYNCTVCGYTTISDYVAMAQHDFVERGSRPATCTEEGAKLLVCTHCGTQKDGAKIPKLPHTFTDTVIEPTCDAEGYTLHVCSVCGFGKTDTPTPRRPHKFTEVKVPATCAEQGYTLKTCENCGKTEISDYTPTAPHTYEAFVTAPTQDQQGYTTHVCKVCGDTYISDITDVLPPSAYSIRFDANGGSGIMADQYLSWGIGQNLTSCAFTRRGYTFAGWESVNGTFADGERVLNLTEEDGAVVVLRAVWKVNTYTVTFDANGGTGSMPAAEFTYGSYAALPEGHFSRRGFEFLGWSDVPGALTAKYPDGMLVWNLTDRADGQVTLYAVWDRSTCVVTYDANGGRGTMADRSFGIRTPVTLDASAFYRSGYTFIGWSLDPAAAVPDYADGAYLGVQIEDSFLPANSSSLRLYAVWRLNTYSVSFDAAGGEGSMDDAEFVFGQYARLPQNTFTRAGYTFAGWAISGEETDSLGKVRYFDRQAVWNLASLDGASVTLSAVWIAQ